MPRQPSRLPGHIAEGEGFEPSVPHKGTTVFETAPFDHSGTPPEVDRKENVLLLRSAINPRPVKTMLIRTASVVRMRRGGHFSDE